MSGEVSRLGGIQPETIVLDPTRSGKIDTDREVFDLGRSDVSESDRLRAEQAFKGDDITDFIAANDKKYQDGVYDESKLSTAFNFDTDISNMEVMLNATASTITDLDKKISDLNKQNPVKGTEAYNKLQDYKEQRKTFSNEKTKLERLRKDASKARDKLLSKFGVKKSDTFINKDVNTKSSEDVSRFLKNSSRLNARDQETYLKKLGFEIDDKNLELIDKDTPQPYFRDRKTGIMYGVSAADDGSVNLTVTSKDAKKTSVYKLEKEQGNRYGTVGEDGKRQLTNSQKKAIVEILKSGDATKLAKLSSIMQTVDDGDRQDIYTNLPGNRPVDRSTPAPPSNTSPSTPAPDKLSKGNKFLSADAIAERKETYITRFKKIHQGIKASPEKINDWAEKMANMNEYLAQKINEKLNGQKATFDPKDAVMSVDDYKEYYMATNNVSETQAIGLAQRTMDVNKKRLEALDNPSTDIRAWIAENRIDLSLFGLA